MVKLFCSALLMVLGCGLMAADPVARIDIDGKDGQITLAPSGGNSVCSDDNLVLSAESAPLTDANWQPFSFSFIPAKSGTVSLVLEGGLVLGDNQRCWLCFDRLETLGSAVVNGDFEIRDVTGGPAGWALLDRSQYIDFKGNYCVKVRYDHPAVQKIKVKAGQRVTIRAQIRRLDV